MAPLRRRCPTVTMSIRRMTLGAGYPETGSTNESAIHWDLICDLRDGGLVQVDGEPFLVDGRYVV